MSLKARVKRLEQVARVAFRRVLLILPGGVVLDGTTGRAWVSGETPNIVIRMPQRPMTPAEIEEARERVARGGA